MYCFKGGTISKTKFEVVRDFLPDLDPKVIEVALQNLSDGTAQLIAVSGWQGSGKDTIAPALLERWGFTDVVQMSFASALREELGAIIATIRKASTTHGFTGYNPQDRVLVAEAVARECAMSVEAANRYFAGEFATEVLSNPYLTPQTRTVAVRRALQVLGTEVRRAQDVDYWARPPLYAALPQIAAGRSVYFSDARFDNEVDGVRLVGGLAIRFDVTAQTQAQRIWDRDQLRIDPASREHASEVALDNYPSFDARVSNDGTVEETLTALTALLPPRGVFDLSDTKLSPGRVARLNELAGAPAGWYDGVGKPVSLGGLWHVKSFLEAVTAIDSQVGDRVAVFPSEEGTVCVEWVDGNDGLWMFEFPGGDHVLTHYVADTMTVDDQPLSLSEAAEQYVTNSVEHVGV